MVGQLSIVDHANTRGPAAMWWSTVGGASCVHFGRMSHRAVPLKEQTEYCADKQAWNFCAVKLNMKMLFRFHPTCGGRPALRAHRSLLVRLSSQNARIAQAWLASTTDSMEEANGAGTGAGGPRAPAAVALPHDTREQLGEKVLLDAYKVVLGQ